LYLVTKQADIVGEMMRQSFGAATAVECRGYVVFSAATP
jgi:hypothetical protein